MQQEHAARRLLTDGHTTRIIDVGSNHGDMRQSPAGIYIYGDAGTTEVPLPETRGAYAPEFDELYDVLVCGKPCCTAAAGVWRRWRSALRSCSRRRNIGIFWCNTRLCSLMARRGTISSIMICFPCNE